MTRINYPTPDVFNTSNHCLKTTDGHNPHQAERKQEGETF